MPNCLNCNDPWVQGEIYCSACGQKTKVPNLSLKILITDFFQNLFNLDAKIWMTLKHIWVPAKITKAYLHGQRVTYYNPIRIFLISLFTLVALVLYISNNEIEKASTYSSSQEKLAWKKSAALKLDTLYQENNIDTLVAQKIKSAFLLNKNKKNISKDTTITHAGGLIQVTGLNVSEEDNSMFGEAYRLTEEEFVKKNGSESANQKMLVRQVYKIFRDPSSGIKFAIGNGAWAIIALIILFSAFYKLLHIRHEYLYVEHFLFHLNGHTRMFLIAILLCLVSLAFGFRKWYSSLFVLIGMIYLFIDSKQFYNQSYIKTFFKTLCGLGAYFFFGIVCMAGILMISLLIF